MKKILFLAVSFFMTLAGSAATRTIWTGSFSSGDWGAAFQPLEATLFEGVEVGNYVVFIATTQSDSQIQIAPMLKRSVFPSMPRWTIEIISS